MKLMGHRGAKAEYPENTLGGFQYAFDLGCSAIEFDIHLTKDNKIAVIHDDTLERTTNGNGKVSDFTMEQLKELDAGKGEQIPTLRETLELVKKNGKECQIELKSAGLEKLTVKLIQELGLKHKASIISFNHRFLAKVKEIDSEIATFPLLYGLPVSALSVIDPIRSQGISLSISTIDSQLIEQCHQHGKLVTVWNVNNKEDFQKFSEMEVDYMGTDTPSLFLK